MKYIIVNKEKVAGITIPASRKESRDGEILLNSTDMIGLLGAGESLEDWAVNNGALVLSAKEAKEELHKNKVKWQTK